MVDQGTGAGLIHSIIKQFDPSDKDIERDTERLQKVRKKRAAKASEYFSSNASDWDKIRSLHIDEASVEAAMLEMVGETKINSMLDLGTGTGRMLELFSGIFEKGVGIDASRDMLSIARSRLDEVNLSRVQTRQGDLYTLPTPTSAFDLVTIHQVLHYLDNPLGAITEATKALVPGGRLLIADFAPHELNFLREDHAHLRLGFSEIQMADWLNEAGLKLRSVKHLPPQNKQANDALTVSLWLAEK